MKIRTQLLVSILGVTIVGFSSVIMFSYVTSRQAVVSEIFDRADNIKLRYQEYLDGYFRTAEKIALGMTQAVKIENDMSEETVHKLLKENLIWNPEIYGATLFFDPKPEDAGKKLFAPYYYRKGQLLKYTPAEPNFNFNAQEWYAEPKKEGHPIWTKPYYDAGAGAIMTSYSVPIYRDKFIGLSVVDIGLNKLSEKVNAIQIGKSGYALLIGKEGTFLSHPNAEEYVLKKNIHDVTADAEFKNLAEFMTKGHSGAISVTDPFTKKRSWVTYGTIPSTGYSLAIFIPENELLTGVNRLGRNILWVSMVALLLIILAIVVISWRITDPIKSLSESARRLSEGNLDENIKGSDSKNEVGDLTRDIHKMVDTIKQMIFSVREERDKFENVFSTMSDAIIATNSQWKVINYNAAAERMFGVSPWMDFIGHLSAHFKSNIQLHDLLDYKKRRRNLELVRPESDQVKEMIFSVAINTIVDSNEQITSYVWTARDVTQERREELNKNNLLSVISHKLKTPITVLLGTTYLFRDKMLGALNERQIEHINKIQNQALKVQGLVDRLIGYVTLTGTAEVPQAEIDISDFVRDLVQQKPWDKRGKTINIELNAPPSIGIWHFNRDLFRLVILELIENAIKFNSKTSVEISILVERAGNRLKMTVKDNGIGISEVYHDKIFERFFQIDKYFTGNTEGIGLGLSLVKAFAEGNKGKVNVASEEGTGAIFTLEFDEPL